MSVEALLRFIQEGVALGLAGAFGLVLSVSCLIGVVFGLVRMGRAVRSTSGYAALAGFIGLALVCLLFAQKANGPRTGLSAEPHAMSARTGIRHNKPIIEPRR